MPKAIISNRIYMDLPANKEEIFKELTYRIVTGEGQGKFERFEIIRNYRMVTPTIISIPQGREDLIPKEYTIVDKRVYVDEDFPAPKFPLHEGQQEVYDEVFDSCFINALVGWGKTFTALWIAYKLGQKTLVVVHTSALRDQWAEEIKTLFNITPGTIGEGKYNIESPIVVANIQSLVRVITKVDKAFGTIIMDEAHHTPASTFTSLLDSCHARYRIALSGTMNRKDGKQIMFKDFFGPRIFKPKQNNTINPSVRLLKTNISLPAAKTWADKVTKLLEDRDYQELVAGIALVQANKGHKVLIIADRVIFLQNVHELLEDRSILVLGETKEREKELDKITTGKCDIVCGSRSIFSEGISQNNLSCVILATPIAYASSLEQIIGRVMRLSEGKLDPIVIDLQFKGFTEQRQNAKRVAFYLEKGWEIKQL
jgi:superfamily II DNA or RNA helicase